MDYNKDARTTTSIPKDTRAPIQVLPVYLIGEEEQESRTTLPQGGGGDDVAPPIVDATPWPRSPPSGPTTQTPAIYVKVNSFLSMIDLNTNLNGMLPHAYHHSVYRCRLRQGPREKELPWCKEERRRRKEEKKDEEEEPGG
jgi:hypothetical protein